MNTESDLIEIDIFLKLRKLYTIPIEHIQVKADTLYKTFTCFQEVPVVSSSRYQPKGDHSSSGKWSKNSHQNKNTKPLLARPDRLSFLKNTDSKEEKIRRELLSFINKLSEGTRKNITTYFENNYNKEYIDIYVRLLWEAMLRSEEFQKLYIDCFEAILLKDSILIDKLNELFNTYISTRQWIPTKELIDENDYDDFCDFVKWKKTTLTYIHGFSKCIQKTWLNDTVYDTVIDNLTNSIGTFILITSEGCKVTDALLEQLLVILEYTSNIHDEKVARFIESIYKNTAIYKPSTRFKVYDIKEYLDRKKKFGVKHKN
jgi:hypothetical protein